MTTFKGCIKDVEDISEVVPTDEYSTIWHDISYEVQKRKAINHKLSESETQQCFKELKRRPYYLCSIAERFGVKNIAEVGTAEGLQFYSFANLLKETGGHIWSCDIKDVRNKEYALKFENQTTFCLGNSELLKENIQNSGTTIDMFYIDGSHDYGDVIRDVFHLKGVQSENPIWVFDDFDNRFGCYRDIKKLIEGRQDLKIYRVGNAASGNPNHQVIIRGKY